MLTIQTLALPTLPFDAFLAVVAYGVLIYSFSFRYLPLYPQELRNL